VRVACHSVEKVHVHDFKIMKFSIDGLQLFLKLNNLIQVRSENVLIEELWCDLLCIPSTSVRATLLLFVLVLTLRI